MKCVLRNICWGPLCSNLYRSHLSTSPNISLIWIMLKIRRHEWPSTYSFPGWRSIMLKWREHPRERLFVDRKLFGTWKWTFLAYTMQLWGITFRSKRKGLFWPLGMMIFTTVNDFYGEHFQFCLFDNANSWTDWMYNVDVSTAMRWVIKWM